MLSAVDEFPLASQLLVHVLSKHEPPPELRAFASLQQWETVVEAKARQALQYGEYGLVRQLLSERPERTPGSALYAIAAVACMSEGRYDLAREQLDEGIESAQSANSIEHLVELWRLRGELLERQKHYTEADSAMAEAQKLALRIGLPALALQAYAGRVRLLEESGAGTTPPIPELEEIVRATAEADFASIRLQLRGLFRSCGKFSAALLTKGLRVFKLLNIPYSADFSDSVAKEVRNIQPNRLNEFLQGLLDGGPQDSRNRAAIADILEDALDPRRSARAK
jgi:tetratricopeptide (TPR) repeat protein